MTSFVAGIALFGATAFVFRSLLPNEGRVHRLVDSFWGPYVGIGITTGFTVAAVMVLAGLFSLAG
jgi:hypothetical protein